MIYPELNQHRKTLQLEGEVWKPVLGWEGLYSVSNFGRVKRERRATTHKNQSTSFPMVYPEKILSANCDSRGYPQVALNAVSEGRERRVARVHRLVTEAFLDNPENKPFVNHKNSNPLDARVENLEWCTASENIRHAIEAGRLTYKLGEESPTNKHDADKVRRIYIEAKLKTMPQEKIGKKYGVPQITVSNILTKKTWGHLTDGIDEELDVH